MTSRPSGPPPPTEDPEMPSSSMNSSGRVDVTTTTTTTTTTDSDEYHNIEIRHVAIEKQQQQQQQHDGSVSCKNDDNSKDIGKSSNHDDIDMSSLTSCSRTFKLSLTSNVLFVVASFLYVLLAAYDLDYAYVQSLSNVSGGDDDGDSGGTDDGTMGTSTAAPTTGGYAAAYAGGGDDDDDGSTELAAEADDDYYLFATKNGVWVSKYQIIYFVAALCFVVSGVVDCMHKPGRWLSVIFIVAGCFGLVSAMLVEEYEYLSAVFDSVSAHLFMVEAVGLFLYHRHIEIIAHGAAASTQQQLLISRLYCLLRLADGSFIAGTCMDVVLSYCYIRGTGESIPQGIVGVVAANLWLLCSLIYLMVTCMTESQVRKQHVDKSKAASNETSSDDSSSSP
jgi:hypothetical protein